MTAKNIDAIDQFMKVMLKNLTSCVRSSFDLPTRGTSEDSIFNEFPQYRKVVNGLSLKILNNIQILIDEQDGKRNILDTGEKKTLDDKFSILVEVNDRLLDKCNNLIAAIENPDSNKTAPVFVVEYKNERDKLVHDGAKMTPKQTIKLLSSKQIERPQLKFKRQPDNSKTPFRPILTKKPNALKPLEISEDPEDLDYPHPYGLELEHLEISKEYLKITDQPIMPKSLEETPYEYIDTVEKLQKMITDLKQVTEIAVDLEHHNVRTYLGLTCLLQISSRSTDYIVDTIALRGNLEILNEVFTDPSVIKVFHGANMDVLWLQRDLGVYVVNMFDTGHACTSLNFPRKSLSHLLELYCKVRANKEYQRLTDWRIRPLIPELIEYARTDTHFLLYIYDCMKKELIANGRIEDVFESSKRLCQLLYHKPTIDEHSCMDLYRKSNEQFNPRQLYALRRMWELRDNIAREEDESPQFVLENRLLLSLAQALPRETSGVLACCSQDWKLHLLRKYVYDFQKICLEAYSESLGKANKVAKTKGSILDRLLSKHDQTVTEEVPVTIDVAKVRDMMKEPEISFVRVRSVPVPPMVGRDESIVKTFLACHPVTVAVAPGDVEEEEEAVVEEEDESAMDTVVAAVIEDIARPFTEAIVAAEEDTVTVTAPAPKKQKREPKEGAPGPAPFNFDLQLQQLKEESRTDKKTKSFNPMVTKKFRKNQKGKK